MHRLGRDDELIYKPDNPRLLARPYVYAAGCSSMSTTSRSGHAARPLITGKEQSGHAQAILGGRGGRIA